jgi:hypothetical protein
MVERMYRKLATMVKAMLLQANASQLLWGEAITYATYIHNRTPLKVLGYVTPFYLITGTEHKITVKNKSALCIRYVSLMQKSIFLCIEKCVYIAYAVDT